MQDIANINNIKLMQTFFNNLFDIENMINLYTMSFNSFLAYYYSKKSKNSTIKNNIS